jgi:ArsR family transcriptional regulator, arsenate/arsenite/antimonite-responsive transcriptional repressor
MQAEADVFKALGDPTRLRLAVLLAIEGEVCVCRLAEALDAPDFRVSRHLGVMRAAGLVEARRDGTWMYYRLSEPATKLEACLHDCFRDCLAEIGTVRVDRKRMSAAACK